MKKVKEYSDKDQQWQSNLKKENICDDNWTVKVIMIEASDIEQENMYLKEFEKGSAQGNRFVVRNISKVETLFMIKQLGGQNKAVRVFMEAQSYLKDNKNVPADILALIIKHLILEMKEDYLHVIQQKHSVKEGLKHESDIMINKVQIKGRIEKKGKISADSSTPKSKTSDEKKVSSSITEGDNGKKYHTALRMRGEEWRDKEYLEDFPEDGPNLYVAITGFIEPYLPGCLIRIGVPLIAIVKLEIAPNTARTTSKLSRNNRSDTDLSNKYHVFWKGLQTCRSECDRDTLKNTAMVVFSPSLFDGDKNINDPEVMKNNQEKIYDEMCHLFYDLQDLTRQHLHFLNNFQVSLIPDEQLNESLLQEYFSKNTIPLESTTIYSILDSILQTVSKTNNFEQTLDDKNATTKYILEKNNSVHAETFIQQVFGKLRNNDVLKKKYRVTQKNEFENEQNPIIIHFGDRFRYSTFHLRDCNLQDAIWLMLRGLPVLNLWEGIAKISVETKGRINFHINLLSSYFDRKVEVPELIKLIQILNCTKLYNARNICVDQNLLISNESHRKQLLKRSHLVKPLYQDPLSKIADFNSQHDPKLLEFATPGTEKYSKVESKNNFIFDCENLSELLINKMSKPNNNIILDDFEYFEEFKDIVSLQVLNDAYNQFGCCIYNYCAVTDTLILMFLNKCDNSGLLREKWRGHIDTPICLQDFLEFVFDDNYDWIQKEEKLYEKRTYKTAIKVAEEKKKLVISGCCGNSDEFDFLIEGSLKHRDILDSFFKSSPEIQESLIKDSSKLSPKIRSRISISSRLSRQSKRLEPLLTSSESSIEDAPSQEIFNGYNLGDRRVEAVGKDAAYFSKDGLTFISKYTSFLHNGSKYLSLNVVVDENEFWIHRNLCRASEYIESSEAFRICTKDKVSVSVKKQTHSVSMQFDSSDFTENKTNLLTDADKKEIAEVISYSVTLIWPNGLKTETVHEVGQHEISYIKQSFILPSLTNSEDQRCISMNGEVIIFKENGNVEILQPAGAYINVSKYGYKVSEAQTKQHGDDLHAPGPLQFKNIMNELIFYEYETVDSNGLCQKWIKDVLLAEQKLLSRTASDYCLGEIMTKRSDGTIIFLNKEGDLVTTYLNKTKITTSYVIESEDIYPDYSVYELDFNEQIIINKDELYVSIQIIYTIESPYFTTITINRSVNNVSIESPNNMLVTASNNNNYEFHFNDTITAKLSDEHLTIYSIRANKENVCCINLNCDIKDYKSDSNVWLHMKDSFGNNVTVDQEGDISVMERNISDENKESVLRTSFDECKHLQEAKAVKFFILRRDLTCAQLVNRYLVEEYKKTYCDRTWSSSKIYKSFGDYRNVQSIVTPIRLTPSERWKMDSKFCNKQNHLVYKDLKHDDGKGFYHWMRPYKLYEPKSIAPVENIHRTLPKAYVLRTLERQWDDDAKVCLRNAQELKTALERYKRAIDTYKMHYADPKLLSEDFRRDEEIFNDDILQKVAQRVYEDLAESRAVAGIKLSEPITVTTRPLEAAPTPTDVETEMEASKESVVKRVKPVTEIKTSLKKYWRRRKEEYDEEQRNKYLLREGSVPPYFRNILGGANWME